MNPAALTVVPQLSTDKLDYLPGDTARIRGKFFPPNEPVTIQVVHADATAEPGQGHEPWIVVTDSEGGFETTWYVEPETSVDKLFNLSATTRDGVRIEMQFTDAIITTTYVLNLYDSGWYLSNGFHDPFNKNYVSGRENNNLRWRDYFVFNLSGVTGTISSATLRAFNPCYSGAPNTFSLYDVSTDIATLMSNSGGVAAFNDLGSGSVLGSTFVSLPFTGGLTHINNNIFVPINSAGRAALQAGLGGLFAFGGDYPGGGIDFILGCSFGGFNSSAVQLTMTVQQVVADTVTTVDLATGTFGGTTTLKATLTSAGLGVGGKLVTFRRFGTIVGTALTNALGQAQLNNISLVGINAGSYAGAITAQFNGDSSFGGSTGSNTLVVNQAAPVVTWPNPAAIIYGTALDNTQLNATANVGGSFAYTPGPGAILNAGAGQTLSTTFTPADTVNYSSVTTNVLITVLRATPVVSVTGGTFTYDGQPHPATGTVTGVGGADLGTPTFTYNGSAAAPINAGTYAVIASFAGNTNYEPATDTSASIVINRATPTLTVNGGTFTFDGLPHPATGSVTGVGGVALGTPTHLYNGAPGAPVNAGTYGVVASWPGNLNYDPVSDNSASIVINRATPTLTVNGGTFTFDGLPHPATGSVTGVGGAVLGTPTYLYNGAPSAPVNAATYAVVASWPGNLNYDPVTHTSASIVINRATPTIAVFGGTFLFDGEPHPATGSVTGVGGAPLGAPVFTYNAAPTLPVNPGTYVALGMYPGSLNYTPVTAPPVTITINEPPEIVEITGPAGPLAVNSSAMIDVTFDDSATGDTHTCSFAWGDGAATAAVAAGAGSCSASHVYTAPGVYTVVATVRDDDGLTTSGSFRYVVVYDPSGGFVTGGGWIDSLPGALMADATQSGKAHFGFVAKYQKGAATGETAFNFDVATFRFKSTSYEWLVISGAKAQFKGNGTINGSGDYDFILTATDSALPGGGNADAFRVKIWDRLSGNLVYDSRLGAPDDLENANPQAIGNGSIVIHKGK